MHDITELPAWKDYEYTQIVGDINALDTFNDDIIKWVPELTVSDVFGIRTFWDLQQNQEKHGDEDWQDKMIQLEMRVAQIPAYKEIAFFIIYY